MEFINKVLHNLSKKYGLDLKQEKHLQAYVLDFIKHSQLSNKAQEAYQNDLVRQGKTC